MVTLPGNQISRAIIALADIHCRINETLLNRDLKSALHENVGSEKLFLY